MRTDKLTILALVVTVAGCAAHPEPIIDTKGVNEEQLARDMAECEEYTEQIETSKGVAKGSAVGAAVGAAAGAIRDRDVGEAAATGALYGGTRSGLMADREKQQVWKRCMRGRGYKVLN